MTNFERTGVACRDCGGRPPSPPPPFFELNPETRSVSPPGPLIHSEKYGHPPYAASRAPRPPIPSPPAPPESGSKCHLEGAGST